MFSLEPLHLHHLHPASTQSHQSVSAEEKVYFKTQCDSCHQLGEEQEEEEEEVQQQEKPTWWFSATLWQLIGSSVVSNR